MKKKVLAGLGLILVACLIVVACNSESERRQKKQVMFRSCKTHLSSISLSFSMYANDNNILPHTQGTHETLKKLNNSSSTKKEAWGVHSWNSCPESLGRSPKSNGYLYTGGGISKKMASQDEYIVMFCPSENHSPLHKCNVLKYYDGDYFQVSSYTNDKMIELLKREITKSGYSQHSTALMKRELRKREK